MAEMCPKLGKNTCSVTYSTPGNYHQTLVTQIGNKTHHFSYNARMNTAKSGVGGMSVVKDNSLSYRIWCGDGSGNMKTVQQIPSELGFIFNEVMGRDNTRDFDPMADLFMTYKKFK